jgi:hypothetical protein
VLTVATFVLVVQHAARSPVCRTELPWNIRPGIFRSEMSRLLGGSETFRQQCRRIAQARYVRLTFDAAREVPDGGRAQSLIERFDAGAVTARVTLRFSEDFLELIPHEIEHVIEQIDRVRLIQEVANGHAWRNAGGAFETARATAAGVRARQELLALTVEPVQADGRNAPATRRQFH